MMKHHLSFIVNRMDCPIYKLFPRRYYIKYCQKWVADKMKGKIAPEIQKESLETFWDEFIGKLGDKSSTFSNVHEYHDEVFKLLERDKGGEKDYKELQIQIENLTMNYDQESIYKSSPYLLSRLTQGDFPTAKEFMKNYLKDNEGEEADILYWLEGGYTLEAICIYVLGLLFSCGKDSPVVKVSTLVHQLNTVVKVQSEVEKGNLLNMKGEKNPHKTMEEEGIKINKSRLFAIGAGLTEFLIEREIIVVSTDVNFSDILGSKKYYSLNCYAMCNFDLSLLPIKLNLPMVYPPVEWDVIFNKDESSGDEFPPGELKKGNYVTLSHIAGGYFFSQTGDIINRFRVLTSHNHHHFNIYIYLHTFLTVTHIINGLQSQPFAVNKTLLNFIKDHRSSLEKSGLLMPNKLASINMREASLKLRESYFKNEKGIKGLSRLDCLLAEFQKRVQRARYEDFVIKLATAYDGYTFYLPAFLDFRGRIYRAGILHFHERDLSKSLITFDSPPSFRRKPIKFNLKDILISSAGFQFQKFPTYEDALSWYKTVKKNKNLNNTESLIQFAAGASDPFQFLSKVLSAEKSETFELLKQPVSQDASASAYQIMSYLLLNIEMAKLTNLIPTDDGQIQDMYLSLVKELHLYLEKDFEKSIMEMIKVFMTRKLVKKIFMPLIYGKTLITINNDIKLAFGSYLDNKDCMKLSQKCYSFFGDKFPDIVNLMKLISKIAWFCSAIGRPVIYKTDFYTTKQNYMCSQAENIQVYNRTSRKRHRVTLRIPTNKKDTRKTLVATFANFIHQKDAFISMKVIEKLLSEKGPIYTVHDNFISTLPFVKDLPKIYTDIFSEMGSPIQIINQFVNSNLLRETPNYLDLGKQSRVRKEMASTESISALLKNQIKGPIHWVKNPIPINHLEYILKFNIPKDINLGERKKLESKIDEIIQYYKTYVFHVSGCDENDVEMAGKSHSARWKKFKKEINKWDNYEENYSLHY